MNKKLLYSLAIAATLVSSASAERSLSKNARPLSSNLEQTVKKVDKISDLPKLKTSSIKAESVVFSKTLKSGTQINYVKCADGVVRKQLVPANNQVVVKKNSNVTRATNEAPSYYENFQSYDGTAYDWIPTDWTDVSKVGTVAPGKDSKKLNLTWNVKKPENDKTIDGDYYARCQVSLPIEATGDVLQAQDEWLTTPSLSVKANENLYFYLGYRPGWTLLDANTMAFTAQNNIVEVHISDDGGKTWKKTWDCLADAKSLTDDELWNDLMSLSCSWIFVPIDLKEYEGKDIKVAFRYVGIDGESACIDAVSIATAKPVASYYRPQGFFNFGVSVDGGIMSKTLLGPAYVESKWINTSSLDSETFQWSYTDPFLDEPKTSTDTNLSIFSPYTVVEAPTLTAYAEGAPESTFKGFSFAQTGGSASYEETLYGACTFSTNGKDITEADLFGNQGDLEWNRLFRLSGDDKAEVTSLINVFEKPTHPYSLSQVWVQASIEADPDAEFTLTIKKIDDKGYIGDVIATGKCVFSDALKVGFITSLPFTFKVKDPITELEEDGIFTIDSALYIEITGFKSSKVKKYESLWPVVNDDNVTCSSYIGLNITQGGKTTAKIYQTDVVAFGAEGNVFCKSFMFNTDATYTWIETEEDTYLAPNEGGSKQFDVNAFYYSPAWVIEEENDGTLPEWITYSTEDDKENNKSMLTFNVDPLPAGIEGRSFDVTVSIPGASKVFKISQGVLGVNDAVVSTIKVANVGGDFQVSYPASVSAVKIYNIAGQLVKDVALTETGSSIIPAQDLAKGIYIMQFNDNQKIKVIK